MSKLTAPLAITQLEYQHQSNEINLLSLAGTLWHGRLWIVLSAIFTIALCGLYIFEFVTPLYPAQAVLALETRQQNVVDIESVLSGTSGGSEEVNTEIEILRSRKLITMLVEILNLVHDPEFNETLQEAYYLNPIPYLKSRFGLKDSPLTETEIFNAVVDEVILAISVSNIRKSLVFSIIATTEEPEKSALIANTLANIYIQNSLNKKFTATEKASKWLSEKATALKLELEASEFKAKSFSNSTQLISAEALNSLSTQLKEMREHISDIQNKRTNLHWATTRFEDALLAGNVQKITELADNALLTSLFKKLGTSVFSQSDFDRQATAILNKMRVDTVRAGQQYEALLASEKLFKSEIDTQSADLVQLQQFKRIAEANGLLYESFLTRLKETVVQQGLQKPDSHLLSRAVPRPASSPRTVLILILSAISGSIFGAGMILFHDLGRSTFRTANDLETYTGFSVLGNIPKITAPTRKDILDYAQSNPASVFSEAIRNLRTSVLLSDIDNPPQVIMSTSSVPTEGKTTHTLTLAQNMAGLGKKVLVLEGDIRKRIFTDYFDIKNHNGLISVMSGQATLEDAVFQPKGMGIDILIGEKSDVNAADIFASAKFANLIKLLRGKYDYIIIDTAPVLVVPDARVIGQHVDAILYSVLWDKTTKVQVKQGLAMFSSVGLHVAGLILNRIDSKKMKRYGYADQYSYTYGGGEGYYIG